MSDGAELAALRVELKHLADAVEGLTRKVDELTAQANRWKGAFWVILGLGGLGATLAQMGLERLWK